MFVPAFIRGRQTLDGPMILSEVTEWCNQKKKKAKIFKVDFEKAYDSVKWDFLDMIMLRVGFGDTWRDWIKGCLISSSASILVMESLHISFVRAMEVGFFKGIQIDIQESMHVSHLFYADDAVFIGEWKEENLCHLISILQCFFLASGLRNNLQKCSLVGVGDVKFDDVSRGANLVGCDATKTPFKYLVVTVGGKMSRIQAWNMVIDKVVSRLSKWKAKTLSIGGRFTITKSVLSSLPTYYFSLFKVPVGVLRRIKSYRSSFFRGVDSGVRKTTWFSWDKVVASKDVGGLGVSSLFAMNHALLFKWIWKFMTQPDSLWLSVIKAILGRGGNLERDVPVDGLPTRCINLVPIKVNILAWRIGWNKLPSKFNMSLRGLEVPSIVCPVCQVGIETIDHLFFSCPIASAIVSKIQVWWGLLVFRLYSYQDWLNWLGELKIRREMKDYLEGTMLVSWWIIWNYRNKLIFSSNVPAKAPLFDLIVHYAFLWCNARGRRKIDMVGWLKCPLTALL
ncbi:RNA-directed DNA polymerase, eukaryota [Tanacetum coccineum]